MPATLGFGIQEKKDCGDAAALLTIAAGDLYRAAVHLAISAPLRMRRQLPSAAGRLGTAPLASITAGSNGISSPARS